MRSSRALVMAALCLFVERTQKTVPLRLTPAKHRQAVWLMHKNCSRAYTHHIVYLKTAATGP